MNVHNFWRCLAQWKRVVQFGREHNEFCGLCFELDCGCNVEKIGYQDALDELSYWAEINIMEAVNSGKGFVQDNQGYDRDHVYPLLPEIIEANLEGVETLLPEEGLVARIARGTRQWIYDGENFITVGDEDHVPQGITWGVFTDQFHPIVRYDYPVWTVYKKQPPYGQKVVITDKVPHHEFVIAYR